MDKITKKSLYPMDEKPVTAPAKSAITSEPTSTNPKGGNTKAPNPKGGNTRGGSNVKDKAGAIESQSQFHARSDSNHQSKFKVGDRVVMKSIKDEVFTGTVKWVGTTRVYNEGDRYSSVVAAVGVDVVSEISLLLYIH